MTDKPPTRGQHDADTTTDRDVYEGDRFLAPHWMRSADDRDL
jgi:hypothetical protein